MTRLSREHHPLPPELHPLRRLLAHPLFPALVIAAAIGAAALHGAGVL